jgi:transcriptional regulator GlxA family with amidase domain
LDEAAEACGLGRAQFSIVFREVVGLSFGRFSRRLRLGVVAQLLLGTDRPVAAIAAETGFVDASHLHRTFVKHYGCTPNAYRLEHRPR